MDTSLLHFLISPDGENWWEIYSESVGAYVTPDTVAFGAADDSAGTLFTSLISWTGA